MSADLILFLFLAVVAVASAMAMLLARNAVYSAIFLILNFSTFALFYLLQSAPFIAMAQITVYAGAIMVLFLFVIMLLGGEQVHRTESLRWQLPVALLLGVILLAEFIYIILARGVMAPALTDGSMAEVPLDFGSPNAIGLVLFNEYLLPFEVTSVLLLVAMIGAITLTRIEKTRRQAKKAP